MLDASFTEERLAKLRQDIAAEVLRGFSEKGKPSKFSNLLEEYAKKAKVWKEKYYDERTRNYTINRLLDSVQKIKDIISQNPDIHVWNLSLGTDDEISQNFISYDAAVLDELQSNKNIIFHYNISFDIMKSVFTKVRGFYEKNIFGNSVYLFYNFFLCTRNWRQSSKL